MVLVFAGMVNLINIVANQFPTYTKQLEGVPFDALAVGLMMATVMMIAQAICKVALGVVADKNIKISFVATFVAGISGVILVWFGTASPFILYAGAAIFGFFYAACMVLTPCIVRRLFGTLEYPKNLLHYFPFHQSLRCSCSYLLGIHGPDGLFDRIHRSNNPSCYCLFARKLCAS